MMLFRRALTYSLDYLILTTLMATSLYFINVDLSGLLPIFIVVFIGYYLSSYMLFGTTVGERLFKLRITRDDNKYEACKPETSAFLYRTIGLLLISAIPILCLVIFLPKKRSLADRLSMTKVVMVNSVPKQVK